MAADGLVAANGVSPFVGFICNAPSKPSVVYALAGRGPPLAPFDGLFSSQDFGKKWTRRGEVSTGLGFNECVVDALDTRTVYMSGFDDSDFVDKTWRSTDGGQTVQEIKSKASTDSGASFHLLSTPPGRPGPFDAGPDGRTIFLSTIDANLNVTGTFRSTDGGASYVPVSGLPFGFDRLLGFDPTNPSRIYAADVLALKVSRDGGLTFTDVPSEPPALGPFRADFISVDRRGSVFVGNDAGPAPFRTDDGGKSYRSLQDEFRASAVQDLTFDADGKLLVGVFHMQVVFRQAHDPPVSMRSAPL